jgi:DNA polymerase-3 subunit delta'
MYQVIGQTNAVDLLRRSLDTGRLAHSYLFVGPSHVGKTTLALNLAQAVNCEQADRPCGECAACLRIAAGKHADVQIIGRLADSATGEGGVRKEISIGQIRELQQAAALQPYEGKFRVFIIDGAEHLNEESANCLLKTLEEPPAHVLIVLLTVNDGKLLPTIVSRCQHVELFPVAPHIVEEALCTNWGVEPGKSRTLSRLCRGCLGWAVSAAQDESLLEERSAKLAKLQGLTAADLAQRFDFASKLSSQVSKRRDLVEETLGLWLQWWRDLLLVKGGCSEFVTNLDQEVSLRQQAEAWSLADIRGFIEDISTAQLQLDQNANARLVLEVLMLKMPRRGQENDLILQRAE